MNKQKLQYYCKDCEEKIYYKTFLYGQSRCKSCAQKGNRNSMYGIHRFDKDNPKYIDGRSLRKNYCKDCGKKIGWQAKRCIFCSNKERNNPMFGKKGTLLKPHWGKYKGIWMRSSYEIKFAFFLDYSGIKWQYEPKTFNLGNTTYTPDFYIPEWDLYIEIKGYISDVFKKKFESFKRLYSNINIKVLMQKDLQELGVL